jgi:5'-3' exonuclease
VGLAVSGPLLVVDAPSLLFRGFFALPKSIKDADGHAVNGLLGTTNMVMRVVDEYEPRAVVMCFGPDAAPYRTDLYSGYHSERPVVPSELQWQFDHAREFFEAFGWYVTYDASVEADDLLGSYATAESEAGGRTLILTGDRDMYQCATDDSVMVLYIKTGTGVEEVDRREVVKRYGVLPEQVPDFIALRGDPSDGLPGAKGIGAKTAASILQKHGTLEAAIEAAGGGTSRFSHVLTSTADDLRAFKEIATLRKLDLERPADSPLDRKGGAEAARRLGMNRLAERLTAG